MLQQFISTILAFVTSLFGGGTSLPPTDTLSAANDIADYTTDINIGRCFDDFSFALYKPEVSQSAEEIITNLPPKPTSTDLLVQRCSGAEGQTILTAKSRGEYEPYTYTLTFRDTANNLPEKTITFDQNFEAFGPACRVSNVKSDGYSEELNSSWPTWEKILITCVIGDGGFSATEQYSINLATEKVDLIARCDSRPIAILDGAGEVAHYDSTSDCQYPFGLTEDAPDAQ